MKKQRGMAVPIALLLSVMFLMFAVMVMTVQKSTAKFTKKLNVELKAHYLALGGVQHTLLKIKELREYFYDALKWGYHVDDTSGKFVVHDTVPDPRYIHPITRVEVDATHKASDKTEAMKYLDYFKCDIFSYTYYSTIEDGNEAGVAPTSTSGIVKSGGSIKTDDAINTISDSSLGYKKGAGGPGWVSSSDYGDPFDGEYHMSNLGNDATDPIKAGYSSGTDGIAEIVSGGTISGNTATILNSWVRKKDLSGTPGSKSEEGLLRFSTRIIQTGDPNDTSDDTEEDSIQVIVIGIEKPAGTNHCEKSWTRRAGGTQVVKLKKIEKIERRIGS